MHDGSAPASGPPERRLAAVLFVDLVGYSSLAAEDEHRAMRLLALFHGVAGEAISGCGGTLVKTVGDAVFAEFSSTERAVRCALLLRSDFGDRARAEHLPAQLRSGVHVGDVVTSHGRDLYGDGVNIAARLQHEAAPDQVLVSDAVWQHLRQRRDYRFQPLGQRLLKGQHEPMGVYAVRLGQPGDPGVRSLRSRFAARRSPAATAVIVLGLLALGSLGGWFLRTATQMGAAPSHGAPITRAEIVLPDDQLLEIPSGRSDPFEISPDGSHLVYVARTGRDTRLFLRPLGDFAARALPGTEGAQQPFFSPDGRWVGFFAEGSLHKVLITGGEPITLAGGAPEPIGGSWGSRGSIIVALSESGLYTVPEDGGELVAVRGPSGAPSDPANAPSWPSFLPDGQHVLFDAGSSIWLLALRTGATRRLIRGTNARFVASGHLLFSDEDERVRAVSFDPDRMEVASSPIPVLDNVFRGPGSGAINVAVSRTGTLVYLAGGFERSLVLVDRGGRTIPLGFDPRGYRFPTASPDGTLLAVTVDPRPSDIWIVDLLRETATRLTTDGHNIGTAWSHDGSRLAFWREGEIVWTRWPAVGEPLNVIEQPGMHYVRSWTPDGRLLATEQHPTTRGNIVVVDPLTETAAPLVATPANEQEPVLSPDGRWVAYTSDVSGNDEVYVTSLAGDVAPRLVSVGGGMDAVWSPDGGELFYRNARRILAIAWPPRDTPESRRALELFQGPYDFTQSRNWDALPGGRFVMVQADPSTTSRFRVVLNWFDELERLGR
jgi:class 3 adenylate cyclase/Tol biopolymer transport system component